MRCVLAVLLSLLCVVLPLQAGASTVVGGKYCAHMQSDAGGPERHLDCCNDAATAAKTGQLCKTGHECSSSLSFVHAPMLVLLALPSDAQPRTPLALPDHTEPLPAVWRPPTLV